MYKKINKFVKDVAENSQSILLDEFLNKDCVLLYEEEVSSSYGVESSDLSIVCGMIVGSKYSSALYFLSRRMYGHWDKPECKLEKINKIIHKDDINGSFISNGFIDKANKAIEDFLIYKLKSKLDTDLIKKDNKTNKSKI